MLFEGGLGRSTPGVFGVLRVVVFEGRRKATGDLPQKLPQGVSLLLVHPNFRVSKFSDFLFKSVSLTKSVKK